MNKKKYNLFNFNMYKNALKRMRITGILFTALTIFISVIIPVGRFITIRTYGSGSGTLATTPILSTFAFMALSYILYSPVITLSYFSFLNKRNSSDYYHMFPQKRGCIFNTVFAAAITWIIVIIMSCFISTAIVYTILGRYLAVSLPMLFKFLVCMFAASMLVCGATALACSITGTIFTNIIVTGIILFLPRFILTIAMYMITSTHSIFVNNAFFPLLDNRYNLVVSSFTDFMMGGYRAFIEIPNIIYTLILAIIYIIAAYMLFVRRKSETAGNASVGKKTQCVIRICVGMPLCMIPISYLFILITGSQTSRPEFNAVIIFYGLIIYLIAIVLMLLYELLSTRKLRNVAKAIPSIVILGFANAALLLLMCFMYYTELSYNPSPERVDYIKTAAYSDTASNNYFENKLAECPVTDSEAIKLVCNALNNTIRLEKGDLTINEDNYVNIKVAFRSGMTEKFRNIYISEKDNQKLYGLISDNGHIEDIYTKLPEYDSNTMSVCFSNINSGNDLDAVDIYNSLREEYAAADYHELKKAIDNQDGADIFQLYFEVSNIYESSYGYLPITTLTPKTLIKMINYCNQNVNKNDLDKLMGIVSNCKDADELKAYPGLPDYFHLDISTYNDDLTAINEEIASYIYDSDWVINEDEYTEDEKYSFEVKGQEEALNTLAAAIDEYGTNNINTLDNPGKTLYKITYSGLYYGGSNDGNDYSGTYFIWK